MPDPYRTFRDELLTAGLLVACGADGLYGRSGRFEDIVDAVGARITAAALDQDAGVIRFPPVVPRWVVERTGYHQSFPNLTGSVYSFSGDDTEHAELVGRAAGGEDWRGALRPTDVMLCSAACHPLYPSCSGVQPAGGRRYDVYGYVFRNEPSVDPARMQAFRQRELVYLGDSGGARAHRDLWVDRGLDLLGALGLIVEPQVASDPFFGRVGRLISSSQQEQGLKIEILTPICAAEAPTAIASGNCHLDHFAEPFGIRTASGSVAHTACIGFGMERIALALLSRHGLDPGAWPLAVRDRLWA
jgi:seryl-tRNA synthetase